MCVFLHFYLVLLFFKLKFKIEMAVTLNEVVKPRHKGQNKIHPYSIEEYSFVDVILMMIF